MASAIDATQPPEGNATTSALRANFAAAKAEIEALQQAGGQPALLTPTFLNNWVNYGAPVESAGYWKDQSGQVHIQGVVKSGTPNSIIFNLPVGYRPVAKSFFPVISNAGVAICFVEPDGDVGQFSGAQTDFGLAGINFRAA